MLSPLAILGCAWRALKKTVIDHDGIEHAGYLAFLSLLALFPFLVFLVWLGGMFGDMQVGSLFVRLIEQRLPLEMFKALKPRIDEITSGPPQSLKTIAIFGAIWTASSGVEGMRTILNRAYHVATPPAYLFRRLLSIGQFVVMTFFVLCALFILIPAPFLWHKFESVLGLSDYMPWGWTLVRFTLVAAIFFVVVSTIYFVLPNVRQRWKAVVPGAVIVSLFWMGAGNLFAAYLGTFQQVNLIYGSLEGFIVALLFFYVMAIILIYGAELNYQLEKAQGNHPEVKEPAGPPGI